MELKEAWNKTWNFIWKDDSVWSWIISLILAFIIVKFIFFPLLSLAFGTTLPLVVVESGSMSHPGSFLGDTFGTQASFEKWWDKSSYWYVKNNITKEQAENFYLRGGLEIGDIVLASGWGKIKIGDIIIFNGNQAHPIIHRIISIKEVNGEKIYSTKGDHNLDQLAIEKQITQSQIIGKAIFKVPKLGWVKLGVVKFFQLF